MVEHEADSIGKGRRYRLAGTAPRLYERAIDAVTERIARGGLPAGTRITEVSLAEQLGISRAPARRVLVELEARGVLERARGRGYVVLEGVAGSSSPARDDAPLPLLSQPSWELIYGEIENEIVARISFGDWRVNEMKLARHYRVSRTVARDVVGRLQQRGILRKDDSGRWVAPALSHERIGELYELRAILEPVALVKAAPRLPSDLLGRMRAGLEAPLPESDEDLCATLDRLEQELHVALLGYCGNQALMQAITLPQSLLVAHRFLYRWTPRLFESEPFLPEHLEIVKRLQAGDARGAAGALEAHLNDARTRAITRVDVVRHEVDVAEIPYLEPVKAMSSGAL
jgi:DNA-binding GntR family transcriptional regulator